MSTDPRQTESQFQDAFLEYAQIHGWRRAHFRPARTKTGWRTAVSADGKGFVDTVLVRDRVIFAELKREGEDRRPEQEAWGDALIEAGAEYYCWQPSDWPEIEATLERDSAWMDHDWMQIASGGTFHPTNPDPTEVKIEDIAHALGNICRFGGHTSEFYSVAQHSVLVSRCCPPEYALEGLLHDASEAYLGDVVRPLKRSPIMRPYVRAEEAVAAAIETALGIKNAEAEIKAADRRVLWAEARDFMGGPVWAKSASEEQGLDPYPSDPIEAWSPWLSKQLFMNRYRRLTE